jgi:hypothetical protein
MRLRENVAMLLVRAYAGGLERPNFIESPAGITEMAGHSFNSIGGKIELSHRAFFTNSSGHSREIHGQLRRDM